MQKTLIVSIGGLISLFALFTGRGFLSPTFLFGAAIAFVGWKFVAGIAPAGSSGGKPPVPAGFNASFWNKNIALDTTSGALWLRDQDGTTTTLPREGVLGWEMSSADSTHQTNIGPRVVHLNTNLLVKTRDFAKPLWTVRFNAHLPRTMHGSKANYRELTEWQARLDAFYTQPTQPRQAHSAT